VAVKLPQSKYCNKKAVNVVKLTLAFPVSGLYIWLLWSNQADLHSSVALVSCPLWFALALRAGSLFSLLLFLAVYAPAAKIWLLGLVQSVIESEQV